MVCNGSGIVESLRWNVFEYGKPLFDLCWFFMGIAQIALDLPLCQTGKCEKESAINHPGEPLHPRADVGKKVPNHPGQLTVRAEGAVPPPPPTVSLTVKYLSLYFDNFPKGRFQKLLSGFFPLRGGGTPPFC